MARKIGVSGMTPLYKELLIRQVATDTLAMSARRLRWAVLFGGLTLAIAACDLLGIDGPVGPDGAVSYPEGCGQYDLPAKQCERIVAWAATQQGVDPAGASSIELLGDPGCGQPPDSHVLCTRTMQFVVRVQFNLPDGRAAEESLFCGIGGQYSPLCSAQPELQLYSPTSSGYTDVPAGSTPIPTAAPGALAQARELEMPTLDIPIDHLGTYEVRIGEALLPNGLLTEASFRAQDTQPDNFLIDDGVHLDVEPRDPDGPPLWNAYETGWQEGTRRVEAFIRFEVVEFEPGAVLSLRDIFVR